MTTTTVVHLLRHGEVHNPAGVLYGRLPGYHLNENGVRMAEFAVDWFSGRDIAVLRTSPLERARETAEPLSKAFGLDAEVDERLVEAENHLQGMVLGSWSLGNLKVVRRAYNPFRPSWGEPYSAIVERMVETVKAVRKEAWGREAVCVSHQLPIWITRRAAERKRLWHRPDHRQCGLASVTSFTFEERKLVSVGYSEPAASLYPTGRTTTAGA
ncbi:histidine phosphatase family protein [Halostreptopolyspora alba]|uniref:Histidine phosphatase family protein n=1 Tax=Halostreptopolyspora alba TaxID=2487137 RepID=A0A3N0E985_9ACTN|nr:histidine phosphatase family protein [Nocardiopsaceae bacterium YIM 96095]